jgi:hypothetical protein
MAARVSSHGVGFNGKQRHTINMITAEDNAEDTIRPRLEAAGANLDRVIELSSVAVGPRRQPFEIPADLALLEAEVAERSARLVIPEPLAAFLYGPDANKDQEIRRLLYHLSQIGERHHCAVVPHRHLNKSSGTKALHRGNLSIGVIGHARVGLLVAEDPDDASARILAITKMSDGPKQASLRFRLQPAGCWPTFSTRSTSCCPLRRTTSSPVAVRLDCWQPISRMCRR